MLPECSAGTSFTLRLLFILPALLLFLPSPPRSATPRRNRSSSCGTFESIQGTYDIIQGTFESIQGTFDSIQGTFDSIQGTFDSIQGTFDSIQGTFDSMQGTYDSVQRTYDSIQGTFNNIQGTFEFHPVAHNNTKIHEDYKTYRELEFETRVLGFSLQF
jgi:polyisoprenoid-binding protein YceI